MGSFAIRGTMMHWIFLGAAAVAWTWLVVLSASGPRSLAWASAVATWLVHAGTWATLARAERRARSLARAGGWPGWMAAQAEKNRRKALAYATWGGSMAIAMAASDGSWRVGLASASFAFHLGAFPAEWLLVVTQSRLLRAYEAQGVVLPP